MNVLLQDYAKSQAELRPEATAVVLGTYRMSYGELEQSSNRIAHLLAETGCKPGARVCLFVPKSPAAIVAMMATLKAGCIYVPIDITSPAARVEQIVRATKPHAVFVDVTATRLVDGVISLGAFQPDTIFISLSGDHQAGRNFDASLSARDWLEMSPSVLPGRRSSSEAAHILFTSGSTGVPKGVVLTHDNVVHFVEWARGYFGIRPSDRMSGHAPLYFDLSTFDVYGTFAVGAELHLVSPSKSMLPHVLADFIRGSELTQWFSVPSVLTFLATFDAVRDFPSLRRVVWCGDVLPIAILRYWMERVSHAVYTNLYGPTEATIASSYYTVTQPLENMLNSIPIGTACSGEELLVLDERLEPTSPGEIGDLYISGVGLSPGYWRDEERTNAVFLPHPRPRDHMTRIYRTGDLAKADEKGIVYFLGRRDSQIKHRGYRVELGEVEAALSSLDHIAECAVVGIGVDGLEGTAICCAYTLMPGTQIEIPDLKEALRIVLPVYMLPTRWLELAILPTNANEKIDRPRLRELFRERESEASPTHDATVAEVPARTPACG